MIIKRREFLNLLGIGAGVTGLGGCSWEWSVPDDLVKLALRGPGLEKEVPTICALCEGGCGMLVRLVDGLPVGVKGNPNHPLNRGGLCPVGQSALEVLYSPGRLQHPMQRDAGGHYSPISWDEALERITDRLNELIAGGSPQRIALISGEPSSLLNDLAAQFLSALGSPSLVRLSDADPLPYQLSQGIDEVPGFDLSNADLVLSFGLDLYEDGSAPVHAISAMIGNRPSEELGRVVQIGSRLSPSAAKAEQFVAVKPGTHAAFALGVAHVLVREGHYDRSFVAEHTFGFETWTDRGQRQKGFRQMLLEQYYPDRSAQLCGCEASTIVRVARRFARAERPLAIAGGEATRGNNSTWNVLAVHALNALMGAFDRPGGVVLAPRIPLRQMPEVPKPSTGRLETSWPAGNRGLPRTEPLQALADQVLGEARQTDLLFLIGCNPVHDSPGGRRLKEALSRIPMVVSLSPFLDETASAASLVLPTPVFLETWQDATTPVMTAFSSLGLARPVVEPLYESRHPGDILLALGGRLATVAERALPWESYETYLKDRLEGLAVSGQGSIISGSFEETWKHFLEERGWRFQDHENVEEFWGRLLDQAGWWSQVSSRGDWERIFRTPSGRYEFFSTILRDRLNELGDSDDDSSQSTSPLQRAVNALELKGGVEEICLPHFEPPAEAGEGDLALVPFRPLTSRGRLAASSPMVMEMFGYSVLSGWETWAELSPETAAEHDLHDGDIVAVESEQGNLQAVVKIQPGAVRGAVHVPLGLGHEEPFAAGKTGSNPMELLIPASDRLSGTSSLTSTRVRLRLLQRRPHGGPVPIHEGEAV